jgi:hypothetical protein
LNTREYDSRTARLVKQAAARLPAGAATAAKGLGGELAAANKSLFGYLRGKLTAEPAYAGNGFMEDTASMAADALSKGALGLGAGLTIPPALALALAAASGWAGDKGRAAASAALNKVRGA